MLPSRVDRFIEAMNKLRSPLLAFCRRLLWAPADLEDALQETMIVCLRAFRDSDPSSALRGRAFRTATFVCFNLNRRHARAPQGMAAVNWVESLSQELDREYAYEEILKAPASVLERFEDEIAAACLELANNERAILLLKTVGGLTCAEIAGALEIPLGTAQGLLTRARMKMRERLSEFGRDRGYLRAKEPS